MDLEALKKKWAVEIPRDHPYAYYDLVNKARKDLLAFITELEEVREEIRGLESALRGVKRVVQLCTTNKLQEGR